MEKKRGSQSASHSVYPRCKHPRHHPALLAATVAAGIPARDLLKGYTDRAREFFTPTGVIASLKRFANGFMCDPKHLHDVLVSVLGPAATWTMNDSPIRVMLSATAMNGRKRWS